MLLLTTSCVTNRKITYVQKNDLHQKNLPKDKVVRTYQLPEYEYRIQPEDVLSIQFQSLTKPEYNFFNQQQQEGAMGGGNNQNIQLRGQLVDPNGEIEFLEVGKVQVEGLTVFEIREKLQKIANNYLDSPVVNVRLLNFRFTVFTEEGEGVYTSMNNRTTIFEALGMAQVSELSDRKNIKVIRQQGDTTTVAYVNILDEDIMTSPYFYVHQNDVIVIPPLKQRPFRKYFGQNMSLFVTTTATVLFIVNLILAK